MARNWMLCRQEAEALVELLEDSEGVQIHDKTGMEAAAELRELFAMRTHDEEMAHRREQADRDYSGPRIALDVELHRGDFGSIRFANSPVTYRRTPL